MGAVPLMGSSRRSRLIGVCSDESLSTVAVEEATGMGSLFAELEAREATARVCVEDLEEQLAEVTARLEAARENLERLRIARETVSEVMAEMSAGASASMDTEPEAAAADETQQPSAYAGAERQVVGCWRCPTGGRGWTRVHSRGSTGTSWRWSGMRLDRCGPSRSCRGSAARRGGEDRGARGAS